MKLKQYAVWNDDEDAKYWELFDTLKDAAIHAEGRHVYLFDAKKLGVFKIKTVLARVRKRRGRK